MVLYQIKNLLHNESNNNRVDNLKQLEEGFARYSSDRELIPGTYKQ
jgi:hypothetical protein